MGAEDRCFLIGHHDSGEEIYPALRAEVERHAAVEMRG